VTFVWRGKSAPQLQGDFTDWERGVSVTLENAGGDIWVYQAEFPEDAYIEYCYHAGEQRIQDPFNPRLTPNGTGDYNHYFYMPKAHRTSLSNIKRGVPRGIVTRHRVPTWKQVVGSHRTVYLYQPPTKEPCPLLVVWDGRDYLRRGSLARIVDNLIYQKRISPIAIAMVDNGGGARMPEYACSESTLVFLQDVVLPLAKAELSILDLSQHKGAYAVMGASMGGLMALYTALRLPTIFGRVLSQSGAFRLGANDSIVFEMIQKFDLRSMKIWMDIGTYDFQYLLDANRRIYPHLVNHGYDVTYREYPAGHNYPAWRDEVWRGLEHLFGT
jgi:enterochelin esterase family protein